MARVYFIEQRFNKNPVASCSVGALKIIHPKVTSVKVSRVDIVLKNWFSKCLNLSTLNKNRHSNAA